MELQAPDGSSQQVATVAQPSYAPLFEQGLGEIDFRDLIAKNETIFINMPYGGISPGLALLFAKLLRADVDRARPEQV
jgi:hypothetical protein